VGGSGAGHAGLDRAVSAYTYEAAEQAALGVLRGGGFRIDAPPSAGPASLRVGQAAYEWPDDPSALPDEAVARWQSSLASWGAYASAQMAVALAVKAHAEHQMAAARAAALAAAPGSITDRRAIADADEATLAAGFVLSQAKARAALYEGQVNGIKARQMVMAQERKARSEAFAPGAQQDGRR
jgi:hypothetical protein